jgi:CRP-like cAMP-binding protein
MKNWDTFRPFFKQQAVPARTVLLKEGEISKTMYFIEQGCLRTWVNSEGKDITTQFFFEGATLSSIESFRTHKPSLYSIETIEPCILQTLSQGDFQKIIDNDEELKKQFQEHLFKRLFQTQQLFFAYQRIPQHYIASYLGITAVSLSRIRNRK